VGIDVGIVIGMEVGIGGEDARETKAWAGRLIINRRLHTSYLGYSAI